MSGKINYFLQGFINKFLEGQVNAPMQGFDPNNKEEEYQQINQRKSNEIDHFGENHTNYDNEETLVNHIVYWAGYDLDLEAIVNQVLEDEEEATIKLAKAIGGKNV